MTAAHTATPEIYNRAADFYEESPTGQYDNEAVHALRCHFALVRALEFCASHMYYGVIFFGDLPIVKDALDKAKGE